MSAFRIDRRSRLGCMLLLVAAATVLPTACSKPDPVPADKSTPAAKEQPSKEAKETKGKTVEPEAEAREKLKMALDSWTFGDEIKAFEKDHPHIKLIDERIHILPFGLDRPVKLIRYEIGAVRKAKNITDKYEFEYEFAVAMTVQNANVGAAPRSGTYQVGKLKDGKWVVFGEAK